MATKNVQQLTWLAMLREPELTAEELHELICDYVRRGYFGNHGSNEPTKFLIYSMRANFKAVTKFLKAVGATMPTRLPKMPELPDKEDM